MDKQNPYDSLDDGFPLWDNTPRPRPNPLALVAFLDPPEVLAAKIEEFFDAHVFPRRLSATPGGWQGPSFNAVWLDDYPPHPNCKCHPGGPPDFVNKLVDAVKMAKIGKDLAAAFYCGFAKKLKVDDTLAQAFPTKVDPPSDYHLRATEFAEHGLTVLYGFSVVEPDRPERHRILFTLDAAKAIVDNDPDGQYYPPPWHCLAKFAADLIPAIITKYTEPTL